MENIREEVTELQIGVKVRRLRQEKRLTLQALSDRSGLSKPLLSQIENDQVIPPIATLLRISHALKVEISTFFQEEEGAENCIVVRADERKKLQRRISTGENKPPYVYHSLAYGQKQKNIEPLLVEFDVQQWRDDMQVSHEGEEFLFILEGQLELHYGDTVVTLGPGDSVYYESNEPHGFVASGEGRSRAVAVVYSKD